MAPSAAAVPQAALYAAVPHAVAAQAAADIVEDLADHADNFSHKFKFRTRRVCFQYTRRVFLVRNETSILFKDSIASL